MKTIKFTSVEKEGRGNKEENWENLKVLLFWSYYYYFGPQFWRIDCDLIIVMFNRIYVWFQLYNYVWELQLGKFLRQDNCLLLNVWNNRKITICLKLKFPLIILKSLTRTFYDSSPKCKYDVFFILQLYTTYNMQKILHFLLYIFHKQYWCFTGIGIGMMKAQFVIL
jgi:hypothetical protein